MPANPVIRPCSASDISEMVALIAETGFDVGVDVLQDRINSLQTENDWVRVAEVERAVVGLITVHDTPLLQRIEPVARVTLLVVGADFRGKGIGAALLQTAEMDALTRGIRIMEVISNHRYSDAHAFYRQRGYEQSSLKFKKALR